MYGSGGSGSRLRSPLPAGGRHRPGPVSVPAAAASPMRAAPVVAAVAIAAPKRKLGEDREVEPGEIIREQHPADLHPCKRQLLLLDEVGSKPGNFFRCYFPGIFTSF